MDTPSSLWSRENGEVDSSARKRGDAVNGGGEEGDCTKMTKMQRGKDGGAEGRKPSRRDKRLQTNTGDPSCFPFCDNKSPQSIVASIISVKTDT